MAEIKSTDRIAEKWTRVTPQRAQDYSDGVASPRRDWAAASAAAESTYKEGVQKAAAEGRYGRAVRAAGQARWQERTRTKGPQRFSEGVQLSGPDYAAGFEPYARVIRNTALPPRFPKGDPRNLQRVTVIANALSKRRTGATS